MTPLISVTLAYAAGLLPGLRAAPPFSVPAAVAVVLLATMLLRARSANVHGARSAIRHRAPEANVHSADAHDGGRMRVVLAVFFIIGLAAGGIRASAAASDCRERLEEGDGVVVTGRPSSLGTPGAALVFSADVLIGGRVRCNGVDVRLTVPPRYLALMDSSALGRAPPLTVAGRWMAYSRRNGWPRRSEYAGALLVTVATPVNASATRAPLTHFRAQRQAQFRALLPDRWPLAESLLLAHRAGLTAEVRQQWVASGLVHMLAISGMHVGLIAAGVLGFARIAGQPPRRARRAALLVTAGYVIFLGAPSAALRAMLQATLLLVSVELQRPAHPWTALAAAALLILILDPMAALDPGFHLSFAGMIGLIGWRRPVAESLPQRLPRPLRDGLATGIAASALTTPIAALHFGTVSWIGIPATIVAAPVLALAIGTMLVGLLLHALTRAATGAHAWAADAPLALLERITATAAAVPGGHGLVSPAAIYASLAASALGILVYRRLQAREPAIAPSSHASDAEHDHWQRRHRRRRLRLGAAAAAGWVVVSWAPLAGGPRDVLEIHAIDVGQGDAFAIRTPGDRWLLVDAGPRTKTRDAGRDRVVPYLVRQGVRRLHVLVLTHPDADHIGGAPAVLEAMPVELVIDPGLPAGKDMFIDLLHSARQAGQRWIAARKGIELDIDGVTIVMLYPRDELDASSDANDHSVAFRLEYGRFTALFTGDAPAEVEERLVQDWTGDFATTLLKVGHHGSTTSTGEVLLRAARPELALISSGRNNRYGHPAPSVVARLATHGVRVLRTDQLGNVTVRAWRSGRTEVLAD